VHDHFGPTLVSIVKMLVRRRRLIERDLMRNDQRGSGLAMMNQIHEPAVVRLHIALAGSHLLSFEPEFAEIERDLADLGQLKISASMT
jgi:hypothetical protein